VIRAIEMARRAGRSLRGSVGVVELVVVVVVAGVMRGLKGSGFGGWEVEGGAEGGGGGIERL